MGQLAAGPLTQYLGNCSGSFCPNQLIELAYDQLYRLASRAMERERGDHTLQATALVNEALLRLIHGGSLAEVENGAEFCRRYARAVRVVLVDHARKHRCRAGCAKHVPLDDVLDILENKTGFGLERLDGALEELETVSRRQHEIVNLRFFGGFTMDEIAENLGVSVRTVMYDWQLAREWLYQYLHEVA